MGGEPKAAGRAAIAKYQALIAVERPKDVMLVLENDVRDVSGVGCVFHGHIPRVDSGDGGYKAGIHLTIARSIIRSSLVDLENFQIGGIDVDLDVGLFLLSSVVCVWLWCEKM